MRRNDDTEKTRKEKEETGHRSSATKLTNNIKHRLADGSAEEEKQWMKQSLQTLKEKRDSLKGLDNK